MPLLTQLREGAHPLLFPTETVVTSAENAATSVSQESISGAASLADGTSPEKHSPLDNHPAYPCPDCGRSYKLKSSLRNHQKWECGKDPQFQCPFCVYRAKQKMHIGRHMERMHKEKFCKIEGDQVIECRDDKSSILNMNMNATI